MNSQSTGGTRVAFTAVVQLSGKSATGVVVPAEVVEALGGGKRPKVKVTVNGGHTFRSSVAPMGGVYMIGINAGVRQETGVAGGDTIDLALELDTDVREVALHPEFVVALDSAPEAKAFFERLSYSNKRAHAEPIVAAKSAETRQRRIRKSIETLSAGKAR
ncbi:hypothetical protein GCM10027589_23820 [Actinocorallia lasiicapitis]